MKQKSYNFNCASCYEDIEMEECDDPPYLNSDGESICFNCFDADYSFICDNCKEMTHIDERHEAGNFMICTDCLEIIKKDIK